MIIGVFCHRGFKASYIILPMAEMINRRLDRFRRLICFSQPTPRPRRSSQSSQSSPRCPGHNMKMCLLSILQKRNVIIQMFEFTTCQHYGDNFNGPFHGGNNGGSPGGPIIPKRTANPVQGNGSIQRPNQ